jgi:cytoskeleton protein RodZ
VLNLTVKKQAETPVPAAKINPPPSPAPGPQSVPQPVAPPAAASTPAPHRPAQPSPPATTPEPIRPASPPPAASPIAARAPAGSQRLVIRAVEPTWVRVQTDEGRIAEELLAAGASREWTAERRFLLTIGNAGGVELTLNGRALPPLGAKGTVIQRLELPQAPASGS